MEQDGQEKRTKEKTVADLEAQLARALSGAPSAIDEMGTQSGTKDKYFAHFVGQLQDLANEVREERKRAGTSDGHSKNEVRARLQALREKMPDNIFNPALRIPGA